MTTQSKFGTPTQFKITQLDIDGFDVTGLFFSLSVFENIYVPAITGNLIIVDTDGSAGRKSFIEQENIEWIEPISFTFENAEGNELQFSGVLNGLRNEQVKGDMRFYTCEFTSTSVRQNEQTFVTKAFRKVAPEDIAREMVEKQLDGKIDTWSGSGMPMFYVGSRKRPVDIIKYTMTHGVPQEQDSPQASDQENSKDEQAKGRAGFLCWETLKGWRMSSISSILSGKAGVKHADYRTALANRSRNMDEAMKGIIDYEFKRIGDFQTKLRSGAFSGVNVSMDMDKGTYKEYKYYNETQMTEKQKKALPANKITRYFLKPFDNDKFENTCNKAKPNEGDQSRLYLEQNNGSQNSFCDQIGTFTLPLHPELNAGDLFECKINKIKDTRSQGGADEKHSGQYVIESVSHHVSSDGRGYTKIKSLRTTKQQNDATSTET